MPDDEYGILRTHEVAAWPEFKAFMARLGVDAKGLRKMVITLESLQPVVIEYDTIRSRRHEQA